MYTCPRCKKRRSYVLAELCTWCKRQYEDSTEATETDNPEGSTGTTGYVEEVPEGARGYGRYKYRVIGRNGFPNHHTNNEADAEWWLGECRKYWATDEI